MKLVSWNVRGMNSSSKRVVIKGVFQSIKGECLFIQGTKIVDISVPSVQINHQSAFGLVANLS